jgi:hypothetical protein
MNDLEKFTLGKEVLDKAAFSEKEINEYNSLFKEYSEEEDKIGL